MKSPIKDQRFKNVSINWLKNNLKKDLTIDTYNLFSGDIELSLSKSEYNVNAHTSKPVIFQFWQCMMTEPHRICSILTDQVCFLCSIDVLKLVRYLVESLILKIITQSL